MTTITEDYVSFETAKLLKEKGFDCECSKFYMPSGHGIWKYEHYHDFDISDRIECPTIQMVMKWLREEHKIQTIIIPIRTKQHKNWTFEIYKEFNPLTIDVFCFSTYGEACEAAIKYSLKNLI